MTLYFCCDDQRRNLVRAHATLNGIDFVEVRDDASMALGDRQRFLLVTLLKPPASALTLDQFRVDGGESLRNTRVLAVRTTSDTRTLEVEVDHPGDFSSYVLRLVATTTTDDPPAGYDRLMSAASFLFKVSCKSDFDCGVEPSCEPRVLPEPQLDYLARDFNSLRQLMLDRMRVLSPEWQEDHLADLMQVLVDLKAYVADYQHYQLDAINTEAYLFTARRRVSVRRHARLVDYRMHDGASARAWVHLRIDPAVTSAVTLPQRSPLFTQVPGKAVTLTPGSQAHTEALSASPEVFETMHDAQLFSTHNTLRFYTWGGSSCVLPRGATKATLLGRFPQLVAGDVLVFEEVRGARTGHPADADPSKRFAVRLIAVGPPGRDDLTGTDVTEIKWHADDALPASLCLSADVPAPPVGWDPAYGNAISIARGNIVLADHGQSLPPESLGSVAASTLSFVSRREHCSDDAQPDAVPPRYRPSLANRHVSQVAPYDHTVSAAPAKPQSASSALRVRPADALPALTLSHNKERTGPIWKPQRDLLNSPATKEEFVLEVEHDGRGFVRFGDDEQGKRPNSGETFWAHYRVGAATSGNIGRDSLAHVVASTTGIVGVRNPLPAGGGTAPEPVEAVRQSAPQAFRVQERAVTVQDYERLALEYPGVQRAAATLRWTGSWYTVFVTVDREGGQQLDPEFAEGFRAHMNRYRLMGYDLEIDAPRYVPLEIDMHVCVEPGYFRSEVRRALLDTFSTRGFANGTRAVFHPDNFSFGQTVYVSTLYAAAARVAGVRSVEVTRFQPQDQPGKSGLASGKLLLGRLEIAQLENDPSFPKRGVLRLMLDGGK